MSDGSQSGGTARHDERSATVNARPLDLFNKLDEPARLGRHMAKPSPMMLVGAMRYETDAAGGKAVGSIIRVRGTVLGLRLAVDEVVVERRPPSHKVWETIGKPRLLIIDWCRMGFDIAEAGARSRIRISIDYVFPHSGARAFLARWLAPLYAKWCLEKCSMTQWSKTQTDRQGD